MKPPVKKGVVYVVDFARNAIKMGRNAALGQILRKRRGALRYWGTSEFEPAGAVRLRVRVLAPEPRSLTLVNS